MKRRQSGATVLEFTLSLLVLTPLLIGTYVFGFRLVRKQQTDQITRDLAHMYSRGVNFKQSGAATEAGTLANQFGLTSTGYSVVIFSTITIETPTMCNNGTGSNSCANLNSPVFVEQVAIGNTSANSSAFGTPTSSGSLPATVPAVANDYSTTLSASDQAKMSFAVANNFNTVLALNSGETCYMVEMYNNTPDLSVPGLTGSPQVYSRAIF
ncbi:MAG TPA: hypothetical protein VML19_16435 [Verrucomicrobiae bacterium]|nr:hypothetical protein [Verrucomicrobiae bacterium]